MSLFKAILLAAALSAPVLTQEAVYPKAPELSFIIPGQGEQLLSAYRGKVISLEIIHTTCMHCQHASQTQKKLQEMYGTQGFQAVDVAINPNADLLVENFSKEFGVNFPVGWTTAEHALAFLGWQPSERYVVPQIILIDRKGRIRAQTTAKGDDVKLDSVRKEDELMAMVKQLMAEPAGPAHRAHR